MSRPGGRSNELSVTAADPLMRIAEPSHAIFRVMILVLAALLGAQCVWLLLAEFSRPNIGDLPSDPSSAAAAATQRDAAFWTASLGMIRGDLWAESAFTYADIVIDHAAAAADPELTSTTAHARLSLDHALKAAPHRSDMWLLFAGMALQSPTAGVDPTEALKMSYYTGPSERNLIPLRLRIAALADRFDDIQLREFSRRELRVLLNGNQNSAIAEAYKIASPAGKLFIERTVGDLDPSFAKTLRASGAQKQSFPN